jgi:hypothetical protein
MSLPTPGSSRSDWLDYYLLHNMTSEEVFKAKVYMSLSSHCFLLPALPNPTMILLPQEANESVFIGLSSCTPSYDIIA